MTQEQINKLIKVEKNITSKKVDIKRKDSHENLRADINISPNHFSIFIRVNSVFEDNYSIGLRYKDNEGGNYVLFRVNGVQRNSQIPEHKIPHIHILSANNIKNNAIKPDTIVQRPDIKNFSDALKIFCVETNIMDYDSFFSYFLDKTLFDID